MFSLTVFCSNSQAARSILINLGQVAITKTDSIDESVLILKNSDIKASFTKKYKDFLRKSDSGKGAIDIIISGYNSNEFFYSKNEKINSINLLNIILNESSLASSPDLNIYIASNNGSDLLLAAKDLTSSYSGFISIIGEKQQDDKDVNQILQKINLSKKMASRYKTKASTFYCSLRSHVFRPKKCSLSNTDVIKELEPSITAQRLIEVLPTAKDNIEKEYVLKQLKDLIKYHKLVSNNQYSFDKIDLSAIKKTKSKTSEIMTDLTNLLSLTPQILEPNSNYSTSFNIKAPMEYTEFPDIPALNKVPLLVVHACQPPKVGHILT